MNKYLLGIGSIGAIFTPVVTAVSCGTPNVTINNHFEDLVPKNKDINIDSRKTAEENMNFDQNTKILTVSKNVSGINHKISEIWKDIKEVNFLDPRSITEIGTSAFDSSKLAKINLSDLSNLKIIGDSAFNDSKITELDLSGLSKLESIGDKAFYNSELKSLDMAGLSELRRIGDSAFKSSQLTTLDLSGLDNLRVIGSSAFESSKFTELDLSNLVNLNKIGKEAFKDSIKTKLDLSKLSKLEYISGFNNLGFIDLGIAKLPKSKEVDDSPVDSTELENIDLSKLTNLEYLSEFNNSKIVGINKSEIGNLDIAGETNFWDAELIHRNISNLANLNKITDFEFKSPLFNEFYMTRKANFDHLPEFKNSLPHNIDMQKLPKQEHPYEFNDWRNSIASFGSIMDNFALGDSSQLKYIVSDDKLNNNFNDVDGTFLVKNNPLLNTDLLNLPRSVYPHDSNLEYDHNIGIIPPIDSGEQEYSSIDNESENDFDNVDGSFCNINDSLIE